MAKKPREDAPEEDKNEEGESSEDASPKPTRFSGKKLILFVVLPLVLVLAGGGGALFFLLGDSGEVSETAVPGETDEPAAPEHAAVFFDLPQLLVNLNTSGRKSNFLKIGVALELEDEADMARVEAVMPRIIDNFQVYLRELRIDDLRGSAGIHRLREELLARVNEAAAPAKINDVLFKEMLVQ
jgi:flagellar FliL protein